MNLTIKYPTNSKTEEYVQFYIFSINKKNEEFTYKTFPNTNLCLSLYKGNKIITNIDRTSNRCSILAGNNVQSRLWGFHKQPFEVFIDGVMDQISVIFHPGALRKFTKIPYEELMQDPDVFNTLFGRDSKSFVETLFSISDFNDRVALLDAFLLRSLRDKYKQDNIDRILHYLDSKANSARVLDLTLLQHVDASTLYRQFIHYVGQAPKEYLKVVRFRQALHAVKKYRSSSLLKLTYDLGYCDQSHFIKDFKRLAKDTPRSIHKIAQVELDEIIWVVNK